VLLCDGLACDGYIFKYLWDDLAQHFTVVHWNYRGHGRSALPSDPHRVRIEDLALDLNAVRDHAGDPPVIIVGHSLGTQVALEAYRQRPAQVRALVFLCGTVGRITHTLRGTDWLAQALPGVIEWTQQHPKLARGLWSRVPSSLGVRVAALTGEIDARSLQEEDMEPYFTHAADLDVLLFLRMLQAAGEHSAEEVLPTVQVPVLVVAGERDSFTPPEQAEAIAAALPRAELLMIPGATHVAPLEQHELVALRLEKFFTDCGLS